MSRRMRPFTHVAPRAIEEVIPLLREDPDETRLLAGGTDLIGAMRLGAERPDRLVSLKGISGLDSIREDGGVLRIGALARISTILASSVVEQRCRALHESTLDFATPQIRSMATIGGNICRSSPGADTVPPLLAYGAELSLIGRDGERTVPLADFFTGPGQNVLDREVLTEIRLRLPEGPTGSAFAKLARNSGDLAKVNCAVAVSISDGHCEDVRIALGAVADRPIRARATEEVLRGQKITGDALDATARKVREEISPITDVRATASWRSHVSLVLTRRILELAIQRAA
jgi:carbon-monoxide dehydrogenase medium subunit